MRDVKAIGARQRRGIDFAAAHHADLIDLAGRGTFARELERRVKAYRNEHTGGGKVRTVRHDDDVAPIEDTTDRLEGLAAHDERLAQGDGAKSFEVGPQPPGKAAGDADDI